MLNVKVSNIKSYSEAVIAIMKNEFLLSDSDLHPYNAIPNNLKTMSPSILEKIELFRNIAMFLVADSSEKESYQHILESYRIRKDTFKTPVLIVAGGSSLMDKTKTELYRKLIREIIRGFKGTIISGGTTDGIPGLVGEVKSELEKQSALDFSLVAYLPWKLPDNVVKSEAYDSFHETDSDHFSALEILSYWCDLVFSGIHPSDVILIGINGGDIAAMEYRIALSLGAKVGVFVNSGRAVSDLIQDETWKSHSNLFELPHDPVKVRAFVNQSIVE